MNIELTVIHTDKIEIWLYNENLLIRTTKTSSLKTLLRSYPNEEVRFIVLYRQGANSFEDFV